MQTALLKKGIGNSMQLHRWFPIRYIDNQRETGLDPALVGQHVSIVAVLNSYQRKLFSNGRKGFYLVCKLTDRLSGIRFGITIFSGYEYAGFVEKNLNKYIFCSGILEYSESYNFYSLKCDIFSGKNMITDKFNLYYNRITPVFSSIKGINPDEVFNMIGNNLVNVQEEDTIPKLVKDRFGLMDINKALWNKNFPDSWENYAAAEKRLLFDDLYYVAARFTLSSRGADTSGIKISKTDFTDSIINSLPYHLTEDQEKTFEKIKSQMLSGKRISALVQGDVSCGKTITAILASFLAMENGYQAVIMAPTKILAGQHYEEIKRYLEGTEYNPVLLAGSYLKKKDCDAIKSGKINIIVGTSQVLSQTIEYNNIGMIVVDEEHKFGVEQREKILKKAENSNYIAMSATPIPRTLAKALYGDNTDIYEIHSMPGGRLPVKTYWANDELNYKGLSYILARNNQAYVICPAIEKSENCETMDGVITTSEAVQKYRNMFPQKVVEELNGKMSKTESDDIISRFKEGQIDILVSTTIVEVGVNVPNATMIIIENAERFGLSQMHQLRGRVGRGQEQSFCALTTKDMENERVKALCSTNNGFEIAQIDLMELRKSGDLFGNEQSGFNRYVEEIWMYEDFYKQLVEVTKVISKEELEKHIEKMIKADILKIKPYQLLEEHPKLIMAC